MKSRFIMGFLSCLIVALLGYYLGKKSFLVENKANSPIVNKKYSKNIEVINEKEKIPSKAPSREIASISENLHSKKEIYRENLYWQKIKIDPQVRELYEKTYEKFQSSPQAEDIAVWTALGIIFDSSEAYGSLLSSALNEINRNKEENFSILKDTISKMPPEDSFLRGMTLNLAYNIQVSQDKKISFFGSEIVRPVKLDSDGKFTPDSLNITTAMIFLKHNIRDPNDAKSYILKSLANNKDPNAKKQILVRLKTYFPKQMDDLEN